MDILAPTTAILTAARLYREALLHGDADLLEDVKYRCKSIAIQLEQSESWIMTCIKYHSKVCFKNV